MLLTNLVDPRSFWPGVLSLNGLIIAFEVWMAALWYAPWWQMGVRLIHWESDMRQSVLPNTQFLAWFPGALELRRVEDQILFRASVSTLWLNPWHGRVYLVAHCVHLELRGGISPLFLYPALLLVPHAGFWLIVLFIKDLWLWHHQKVLMQELLYFLR